MKSKLYRLTVLGVEQTLKMKFFIILNIIMFISVLLFVNFSTLKHIYKQYTGTYLDDVVEIMLVDDTNKFENILNIYEFENIKVIDFYESGIKEDKILLEIQYDEIEIINSKITANKYMNNENYSYIQTILNDIRNEIFSERYGVSLEEVQTLSDNVEIDNVILDVDATEYNKYSFVITAIAFILYILFIFVATTISSTIGLEKISRTTEYMLTGISEKVYLWYNILEVNIVFLIQIILSGIYYVIANIINSLIIMKLFEQTEVMSLNGMINLNIEPMLFKIIVLTIIQTLLCLLILSIIQAIMTSKVSNLADISNSTMLIIIVVVLVCFILPNVINASETASIYIKILSCIPIASIVMIPKLMLLHQIGNIGIICAILLNVLTLVVLSVYGSKWFKKGLLNSENIKTSKKEHINDINKVKFKEDIFKISIALLMFIVFSNIFGFISILINAAIILNDNIKSLISIITWVLSILPSYLYLDKRYNNKTDKVNTKDKVNWTLMGIFGIAIVQIVLSLLINTKNFDISEFISIDITSIIGVILFITQVAILPAIFEELLFRKAMLNMLSKYGNKIAIVITAVCFGLIHQNITQGIVAFFLGLVLGYVTIKTKSILPAILIHFLNNFAASLILIYEVNIKLILIILSVVSIGGICLLTNVITNRKIFKLDKSIIKIQDVISGIFKQYLVFLTLIIYIIIIVYIQIIMF